ncbi:MAG: CoA ester lyase [Microvirga sp.]|nr:CoA ester lyase [Microvirga sp.]
MASRPGLRAPLNSRALRLHEIATLLFVPGNRPERFGKALAASPDGIVIDLEDATPPADKERARGFAVDALATRDADGPPVFVRINALDARAGLDDLAALADGGLAPDGLFAPMVEHPRDIAILRAHIPAGLPLIVAIETATGLEQANAIARALAPCDALALGAADLSANLGCAFAYEPLLAARSAIVQAAAIGRVAALDVPYLDLRDEAGLAEETRRVKALGFTGKLAIHPAQVGPIRTAYAPTADEVTRAEKIVAAMKADGGAVAVDGRMIDAPVAAAAEALLARAARLAAR